MPGQHLDFPPISNSQMFCLGPDLITTVLHKVNMEESEDGHRKEKAEDEVLS